MLLSERVPEQGVCWGNWTRGVKCPISRRRHQVGTIDAFEVIHFDDRRFTRRAARNLLLLVARRQHGRDPEMLNIPQFDWWYLYKDSVRAQEIALSHGFRIPSRLFDSQRRLAAALADARNVAVHSHGSPQIVAFASWLRR